MYYDYGREAMLAFCAGSVNPDTEIRSLRNDDMPLIQGGCRMFSKNAVLRICAGVVVVGLGLAAISYFQVQQQNQVLIRQAALADLPVTVGFRRALLAHGQVAVLRNIGGNGIAVMAHVVDAASHQEHVYKLALDPGRPTDFGQLQGYTFERGDQLTLMHDGYKPVSWVAP